MRYYWKIGVLRWPISFLIGIFIMSAATALAFGGFLPGMLEEFIDTIKFFEDTINEEYGARK